MSILSALTGKENILSEIKELQKKIEQHKLDLPTNWVWHREAIKLLEKTEQELEEKLRELEPKFNGTNFDVLKENKDTSMDHDSLRTTAVHLLDYLKILREELEYIEQLLAQKKPISLYEQEQRADKVNQTMEQIAHSLMMLTDKYYNTATKYNMLTRFEKRAKKFGVLGELHASRTALWGAAQKSWNSPDNFYDLYYKILCRKLGKRKADLILDYYNISLGRRPYALREELDEWFKEKCNNKEHNIAFYYLRSDNVVRYYLDQKRLIDLIERNRSQVPDIEVISPYRDLTSSKIKTMLAQAFGSTIAKALVKNITVDFSRSQFTLPRGRDEKNSVYKNMSLTELVKYIMKLDKIPDEKVWLLAFRDRMEGIDPDQVKIGRECISGGLNGNLILKNTVVEELKHSEPELYNLLKANQTRSAVPHKDWNPKTDDDFYVSFKVYSHEGMPCPEYLYESDPKWKEKYITGTIVHELMHKIEDNTLHSTDYRLCEEAILNDEMYIGRSSHRKKINEFGWTPLTNYTSLYLKGRKYAHTNTNYIDAMVEEIAEIARLFITANEVLKESAPHRYLWFRQTFPGIKPLEF